MKTLTVKKIEKISAANQIASYFDKHQIPWHNVSVLNWKEFPYAPSVKFRMAHDDENIYIDWEVEEDDVKAVAVEDGGKVYKDSCVELFISFDKDFTYYNIETNCIGKILLCNGKERHNRTMVPSELVSKIDRYASLGVELIENKCGKWTLSQKIPLEVFSFNSLNGLSGLQARANFYKCGDDLSVPHFLTWNAIKSDAPDYHRPECFGLIEFE